MDVGPDNLTGTWSGEFSYPSGIGPTTPFVAVLEDSVGHLSGIISEHDLFSGAIIKALLVGSRSGRSIDFTKTYRSGASPGYDQPVDYVGSLSSDGLVVSGVWSLLDWDGAFEMRRDSALSDTEAALRTEALTEAFRALSEF